MKPRVLLSIASALILTVGVPSTAFAAWVWSPQTGWIGPSGAVKDTPEEQLLFAVGFFERHDYHRAGIEFRKLLKSYKQSHEAAEAQYYVGRCNEEEGDYYKAFLEYRKTVQTYPSTKRFDEILEREYQLGNYFLAGKKRKLFGIAALLPARDKAVEIFQAIVDDGPFSEHGQLAQYKLGLAHLALQDYEAAVSAFEQVISRYPDSPLVDDARFQIAQASLKGTFKAEYDQSPTDHAVRELEAFVHEYPESSLSKEAAGRLEELKTRRAQHEFQVAQFYERRRHPESARIYYEAIVQQFGATSWAAQAAARLQVLTPRPSPAS
ncbi:MAG: outer membrane protein assembly factor BamD [Candidatus Omnitrophica bacterium]|nr:outer membrane protein assembly factor BamD [Candidatus Omnitrophota bacterium]